MDVKLTIHSNGDITAPAGRVLVAYVQSEHTIKVIRYADSAVLHENKGVRFDFWEFLADVRTYMTICNP